MDRIKNLLMRRSSMNVDIQQRLKEAEQQLKKIKLEPQLLESWRNSFDDMIQDKFGLVLFRKFLKSEYSDENLEFWIACEEFKTLNKPDHLKKKAESIYEEFVKEDAKQQANIDSVSLADIDLSNPTKEMFDKAQKRVYRLMKQDSFERFISSDILKSAFE